MATDKLTIHRSKHDTENPYAQIRRDTLQDKALTWEARGLLGYLLSKPRDWEIMICDLVEQSPDGRDKVYRILKELRQHHYIRREKSRDPKTGRIVWGDYELFETPYTALPDMGEPDTAKPTQQKKEGTKKRKTNIAPSGESVVSPRVVQPKTLTLTPMIEMKNAIKGQFHPTKTDSELTPSEWGVIQAAAKELLGAGAKPENIPLLYAYCKANFTTFTPKALASHLNKWRDTLPTLQPIPPTTPAVERSPEELRRSRFGFNSTLKEQAS